MKTKCCQTRQYHVVEKSKLCINTACENFLSITEVSNEYKKLRVGISFMIFSTCMLFSFNDISKADYDHSTGMQESLAPAPVPLTIENVEAELIRLEVFCADEVLAQIKIESAHLKSFLLKRTNNMLGMRYPFKRPTAACGIYLPAQDTIIYGNQAELKKYAGSNCYAVFETWQDAIADYKLWQDFNFKLTDRYIEFLGKIYAEDTSYTKKIRFMTENKN